MVQLLRDLDIETRVRVLENDILLRFQQGAGVEALARPALGQCVDVRPFRRAWAAGRRVPFLAETFVEGLVGEEGKEVLGSFAFGPGVLGFKNVVLEVRG